MEEALKHESDSVSKFTLLKENVIFFLEHPTSRRAPCPGPGSHTRKPCSARAPVLLPTPHPWERGHCAGQKVPDWVPSPRREPRFPLQWEAWAMDSRREVPWTLRTSRRS